MGLVLVYVLSGAFLLPEYVYSTRLQSSVALARPNELSECNEMQFHLPDG